MGPVEDDLHVDRGRHGRLERRQRCFHSIDSLDDICARLAKNNQWNGSFAIEVTGGANVLDRIAHACDVRQPYGRAISIRYDQRLIVLGFKQLVVSQNVRSRPFIGELSFGDVCVLLAQHRAHIFESESGVVQLCRVDVHSHARQRTPADIHLANTFNLK